MATHATVKSVHRNVQEKGKEVERSVSGCRGLQRRAALAWLLPATASYALASPSRAAVGFKKTITPRRRSSPAEVQEFFQGAQEVGGVPVRDLQEGAGKEARVGDSVVVHFDCLFRGLDVASSREARLLGGNRTISEPYEFIVGDNLEDVLERANFSSSAKSGGPKPPPALFLATQGMRVGGKRSVLVPPELGYGEKGYLEIPAGATFELQVELLDVR